ncbi:MAG: lectin-like protein [Bacteroidota bacterium]
MRILFTTLFFLCICSIGTQAQNLWTGNVDSDWNNPGNWVGGVPTTGVTATVPGNPVGGNDPIYNGPPIIDYTIQVSGVLTFNNLVYNNGLIINFSGGQIIINGSFFNSGGKVFDNDGMLENNGTFDNYGTFDNAASATFMNLPGATFNNFATYRSNGTITNSGTTNNYGTLRTTNSFTNNGVLNIYGNFQSPFGSTFITPPGATLAVRTGGVLDLNIPFTNGGSFSNDGTVQLSTAVVLTNSSTIDNNGQFELAGQLLNNDGFDNSGNLVLNDGGRFENNSTLSNTGMIDISICGILIQNASGTVGGTINSDGLIYEIGGTVTVTGGDLGRKFSDLSDRKPPVAGCKPGVFKELEADGTVSLVITDVDKGSYGECGAAIVSRTLTPNSFTTADIGDQVVTLRIEDEFGFVSTCDAVVSILPFQAPITAVNDPDISFSCPPDITVTGLPGAGSAPASWTEPEATSTCTLGGGNGPDCSQVSESIPNYSFMGEFNNSKYFLSNNYNTWPDAKNAAEAIGGHLLVINDANENNFVQSNAGSGSIWIGLTDENSEGTFNWINNDPLSYTNWASSEPSGNPGEDYARMRLDNGKWTDRTIGQSYRFVVEFPCPAAAPACAGVSNNIAGFNFIGEFEGSKFYRSTSRRSWQNAQSACQAAGGRLAIVNSAAKNSFLQSSVTSNTWIGLTDEAREGTYRWTDGEESTYFNWNRNEPNNLNNEDYVEMLQSGLWNDLRGNVDRNFFLEIPCQGCNAITNNINGFELMGEFNDHKYFRSIATNLTWPQAKALAEANGGTLAIVNDAAENEFIRSNLTFHSGWLGYTDEAQEGTFVWINGETTNYTNWRSGEPNNNGNEDYARILQNSGQWTDRDASFQAQAVLEIPCAGGGGNGDGNLTVEQIRGSSNGGEFLVGTNEVAYRVSDDCGNEEICIFEVTVNQTAADLALTNCPQDITVQAAPGATSAVVDWDEPTATSNCFRGEVANVEQTLGTDRGDLFNLGTQTVVYAVFDSCGNFTSCNFNVTVEATPVNLQLLNCPSNISVTATSGNGAIVTWDEPTASTDCFQGGLRVTQVQGLASGSLFPDGISTIIYVISDACNKTEICIFNVNVNACPATGTACDDGDPSTFNDVEDGNCNCVGTPCPSAGTACDDGDPSTENDVEDGFCNCAGTPCPAAGTACDDGDPATTNDTEDGNCNCVGVGCPSAGTACDDGDPSTFNDVEDGNCNCAGTPCPSAGTACDDGDPSTENDIEDGFCNCAGTPCPAAGTACDDGNPDTENDVEDGNCNCAGTPSGTTCTSTENLALNGTARQSSEQQRAEAARAIDGNTNGEFYVGFSISQTNWEYQPWLEIDLGAIQNIETVKVWNRSDCCMSFLSNYHILVSNVAFNSDVLADIQAQAGVDDFLEIDTAERPSSIAVNRSGRYVRIQLEGTAFLSVAEIEVIGCLGTPRVPTCDDGIQNGDETGIDCGGTDCPACCPAAGTACDDSDPNTENDVEDGNCNCAGTPIGGDLPTGYCSSRGKQPWQEWIENVNFGAIDNTSNKDGYGDYTNLSTNVSTGNDYPITITPSFSFTHFTEYYRVWIDFNRDGDLEDAGEMVLDLEVTPNTPPYRPTPIVPATGMISIPTDAQVGSTLMRIAMRRYDPAGPCESFDIGEVEDYKVNIADGGTGFSVGQAEILSFDLQKAGTTAQLEWITNTEYKNDYFVIERSQDGRQFEAIGQAVSLHDGQGTARYEFQDAFPEKGRNFYRILKYHKDGSRRPTAVRNISFDADPARFEVYPNPTSASLFVNLRAYMDKPISIQIHNALGQKMQERQIDALHQPIERFETSNLIDGVYSITVQVENRKRMTRWFVVSKQ